MCCEVGGPAPASAAAAAAAADFPPVKGQLSCPAVYTSSLFYVIRTVRLTLILGGVVRISTTLFPSN